MSRPQSRSEEACSVWGSRRLLALGLPLMQLLTIQELKAVIAGEFGHFHAGDVVLAPLVHSTRAAMGTTLKPFSDHPMDMLFTWYTNWFMRVTHRSVARHQEHVADVLAARVAGGVALAAALRKLPAGRVAFSDYIRTVLAPVMEAGYLPPVRQLVLSRFQWSASCRSTCI